MANSTIQTEKTGLSGKRKYSSNPWAWIPTLYFAEGLPYFAVNVLSVILYTNLGMGVKAMAFYTGSLYLPWVIKPFWSSFIDILGSKRGWILAMQGLIAICFALLALSLTTSFWLAGTLTFFWMMAFFSATHDIAADGFYMLSLTHHQQAAYSGLRNTFYRIASVIGQGVVVYMAGKLEVSTGSIPTAWSITFAALCTLFALVYIYHKFALPKPRQDKRETETSAREIFRQFGRTFATFFTKKHIVVAILFMLLYRLGEALMLKIAVPFLLAPVAEGGLGLTTSDVGIINGTVGVICLLAGGIIGGLAISQWGLKRCLWPMALALTLPCGVYCWMAMAQPSSLLAINVAIGAEQFGYGFGFTAFMLYLIYFCEGEFKTSHYAFCTAFMAAGMMLPGMAAGWIFEKLSACTWLASWMPEGAPMGYVNYFWLVILLSGFTYLACALIHIPADFGRKRGK